MRGEGLKWALKAMVIAEDRKARGLARDVREGGVRDGNGGRCYEGGRWAGHKAANRRGLMQAGYDPATNNKETQLAAESN